MNLPSHTLRCMRSAIDKGLTFLNSFVDDDGCWPFYVVQLPDGHVLLHEESPFFAMAGVLLLSEIDDSSAQDIVERTRQHLCKTILYPGVWKYWDSLPADSDGSAMCSLAVGSSPPLLWHRMSVDLFLSHRNNSGLF